MVRMASFIAVFAVLFALGSHSTQAAEPGKAPEASLPKVILKGTTQVVDTQAPASTVSTTSTSTVEKVTTQEKLNGQVQVTQEAATTTQTTTTQAVPAIAASDYLSIEVKPQPAKHKMQPHSITIQNKQAKHIELLQAEVLNGMDEATYLQIQQERAGAKRRLAGGVLHGLTSVASSFVPYAGLGSMAAYQAIGVGTSAAHATANVMQSSATLPSGGDYSQRVIQRINNVLVSPNANFQCMAVTAEKQSPIVKVIFKDLQTNQIFELQQ